MSEIGTGYIVQVSIDSHRGVPISEIGFSVEFYVLPNRRILLTRDKLLRIVNNDGDSYYALIDSRLLDRGQLWCNVKIDDPEPKWSTPNKRPVIIKRNTGIYIGGEEPRPSTHNAVMQGWDQGYKVDFNLVWGIPKPEVAYIFYGNIVNQITSYSDITPDMLLEPSNYIQQVSAGKLGKTSCGVMAEGDKVVVLIPTDYSYVATKDNGFGGRMPFNEMILGANGGPTIDIDGVVYRIYGEMMTTEGEMFIYVD